MVNIILDENHHYWKDTIQLPGVTEILESVGISDFSAVPEHLLTRAMAYGKAVHFACEYYDKGTLDLETLDIQLHPVLEQWKKFLRDYGIKINPEYIEKPFYSEKYRFCGTPDRVGKVKDKNILIDIKTGIVHPSHAIQLAGYKLGLKEQIEIKECWAVYLSGDKYKIEIFKNPTDMSVFLSALNIYNWKKEELCKK